MMGGTNVTKVPDFSADTAVIAYRDPVDEMSMEYLKPVVTGSDGSKLDGTLLWNGDLNHSVSIPGEAPGKTAWVQFDFGKPMTMRAVTLVMGGPPDPFAIFGSESGQGPVLESSVDGASFSPVVRMPTFGSIEHTMTFVPVTARYFRLSFLERETDKPTANPDPAGHSNVAKTHQITQLVLHTEARVNRFEEKAAFAATPDLYAFATGDVNAGSTIAKEDVIDLTSKMKRDGTLDWTPPAGRWTVASHGVLPDRNHQPSGPG